MPPDSDSEFEALLQFLYMAPIGLMQARMDGEILMVNPLCAQLLMPLSRDGDLSNLFVALEGLAPDLRHRVRGFDAVHGMVLEGLRLQIGGGEPGRKRAQILSLSLLKLDDDRVMAVISDVTASVERDLELSESKAWINSLISGIADYALMSLDERGCIRTWNASIDRITGFDLGATVGRSYAMFYPADGISDQRARDRLHEADLSGWSLDEGWRLRRDGSRFWGSCLIAPLHTTAHLHQSLDEASHAQTPAVPPREGRAYSLIIRDISIYREAREALRHAVYCDQLTGLPNRRAFFEAANLEVQRCSRTPQPLSLVMIDADHFKRVNDRYGHAAGDAVLRHLATAIEANFRTIDVMARIGGEEFVVLQPGATVDEALATATRLCASIAAQVCEIDGVPVQYTISAGVAAMDAGTDGIDALLKRADAALYRAKANGRNRAEHWPSDLAQAVAQPV